MRSVDRNCKSNNLIKGKGTADLGVKNKVIETETEKKYRKLLQGCQKQISVACKAANWWEN